MWFPKTIAKTVYNIMKTTHNVTMVQKRSYKEIQAVDLHDISVSSLRRSFKHYGLRCEELLTNFVIGCPICKRGNKSLLDNSKIYINKTTGAFTCETCQHTGSWSEIKSYIIKKDESRAEDMRDPVILRELAALIKYVKNVQNNTKLVSDLNVDEYTEMLEKFKLPNMLPKTVFDNLQVRLDITNSKLYFPLTNSACQTVGFKTIKLKSRSSVIEPVLKNTHSSGILISRNARLKEKGAVIVGNVNDFLILTSAHVPYNVICLPNGLVGLSQHILPCFEGFTKLILWLGNDLTSWETSRHYAKKLRENRCLFIKLTEKVPLPHINPDQDFIAILAKAQTIWHKSITTFASLREDVLADLQNIEKIQGVQWKRYPGLNRLLKGHRRGELTVFTGPTGSGKTTFISDYSLDLAMQGVNTLWGSFEIRNVRLAKTMLQQMTGFPLEKELEKYDHYADIFQQLPIYYMTFHGQESIKVVMEAIEHAVYVHDIAHVIIDNLQFMMGMSEDSKHMDRYWKQDLIIANFRNFATRRNCHVTLVIHPRKEREDEDLTMSSIFGGAKASQEADNIMIIQDKRLAGLKGKKYLQVSKNRYTGDLGVMTLDFDKTSLSFAPKKKEKKETKPKSSKNIKEQLGSETTNSSYDET